MVVSIQPLGLMGKFMGSSRSALHLPEGATLKQLFIEVDRRWGEVLPNYLWDRKKLKFRVPVIIICNGSVPQDESFPLADGMELQVGAYLSGG